MRRDQSIRNRSVLLTRWRGAARVISDASSDATPPAARSPEVPSLAPSSNDEETLFGLFEADILSSVAEPMARVLLRLLAPPREAVLAERSEAKRAQILAQLDLVEDVLDAVLLAGGASLDGAEQAGRSQ